MKSIKSPPTYNTLVKTILNNHRPRTTLLPKNLFKRNCLFYSILLLLPDFFYVMLYEANRTNNKKIAIIDCLVCLLFVVFSAILEFFELFLNYMELYALWVLFWLRFIFFCSNSLNLQIVGKLLAIFGIFELVW